jgi:molecular chaperone DnaJ
MDAFFGGGAGTRSRGPRSRVRQGDDALIPIELTLEECATGVAKDLAVDTATLCSVCHGNGCAEGTGPATCDMCKGSGEVQQIQRSLLGQVVTSRPCPVCRGFGEVIPDPCRQCNGEGRIRARRTVRANIPAGVGDGIRVRLAGQGEVGPGGGAPGDLYVEVQELQHERFTRDGIDLHCTVHVPMTAAALGTVVKFDTLDGSEWLSIKPGTPSGSVVTLRGRGVPHLSRGVGRGDLHVHLDVETPGDLDGEQEQLLRKLAALRGEESPDYTVTSTDAANAGLFSRLRDAFK